MYQCTLYILNTQSLDFKTIKIKPEMFYWSFTSLVHFWPLPVFNPVYAYECTTLFRAVARRDAMVTVTSRQYRSEIWRRQ